MGPDETKVRLTFAHCGNPHWSDFHIPKGSRDYAIEWMPQIVYVKSVGLFG